MSHRHGTGAALDRNLERWALLIFYSMLVATMAIEVLRREVFAYSSIWGEEIVRYSFIYLVWIGAAAAVRDRAHIRIDVIFEFVGNRAKTLLYILGDLVTLFVACVALYWSLDSLWVSLKYGAVSHGLRMHMGWFLTAVPLGFCLVLYRLQQSLRRDLKSLRAGDAVFDGERLFD